MNQTGPLMNWLAHSPNFKLNAVSLESEKYLKLVVFLVFQVTIVDSLSTTYRLSLFFSYDPYDMYNIHFVTKHLVQSDLTAYFQNLETLILATDLTLACA